MDVGEYLEMNSEYEYGDVKRGDKKEVSVLSITHDDGESSQVHKAGAGRGKKAKKATEGGNQPENVYELPNMYAEISENANYETLQHQPCCRKSTRFWCVTAAMSTVIVILLIGILTGML